jgi:hypothetical protein
MARAKATEDREPGDDRHLEIRDDEVDLRFWRVVVVLPTNADEESRTVSHLEDFVAVSSQAL